MSADLTSAVPAHAAAPAEGAAAQQGKVSDAPAPAGLRLLPVTGLPEFRPGDDLADAIASAAPWLADGDILLVTSKIVSKVEGRLVTSPTDPDERDALRRRLIDAETVRLVAQVGRTKIVENRLGIVAAAAGIDASNVHRTRSRCCRQIPTNPRPGSGRSSPGGVSTSASSSPTPRAGRGASGSPTSRSAPPGCRCWPTSAATSMPTATSWSSPRWPSATNSPRPVIWSRASSPRFRWLSLAGCSGHIIPGFPRRGRPRPARPARTDCRTRWGADADPTLGRRPLPVGHRSRAGPGPAGGRVATPHGPDLLR